VTVGRNGTFLRTLKRPRILVPMVVGVMVVGASTSYYLLQHPESAFMQMFRAEPPQQFGMITIGPYPQTDADYKRIKEGGVKYLVSLLDPQLPYEKPMLEREYKMAAKYGLIVKSFPMFPMDSMLNTEILPATREAEKQAVDFLRNLDGPAYMHCYLGVHRALRVRDEVIKAGIPDSSVGATWADWEQVNRVLQAWTEFRDKNYEKVIELLEPVTAKTADVAYLRGQSYYRLGLFTNAARSFQQGLETDPTNPRNRLGLAFCYLRTGQPVMAQREFDTVLSEVPDETSARVGQGLAYLALQNKPAAAEAFRAVLKDNPDNEEVKGYLKLAESP
jgi:hypothetical protein